MEEDAKAGDDQPADDGRRCKTKRRSYSVTGKREFLEWLEEDGERSIAAYSRMTNIPRSTLQGWKSERENVERFSLNKKAKRVPGAGAKPLLLDYEDIIADVIRSERREKRRVTRKQVMEWALQTAQENGIEGFKASNNWLDNFFKRVGLSLRRRTNLTTLDDDVLLDRAFQYMKYLSHKLSDAAYENRGSIVLMDETALYLEDPRNTTVDETGARHVIIRSTGFSSMRVTCVLAVRANGEKLTPILLQKKKNGDNMLQRKHGIIVAYNDKAWVNQGFIYNWINSVYPPIEFDQYGKLLVWDSCRVHLARYIKDHLRERGIAQAVVPGGLTAYVQAGDIGIYKSFKDKCSALIDAWKASGEVQLTARGNPRPPSEEVVAGWVRTAWRNVPQDVIDRSIAASGFGPWENWHISKHDVYGTRFKQLWESNLAESIEEQAIDANADDPENEIDPGEEAEPEVAETEQ